MRAALARAARHAAGAARRAPGPARSPAPAGTAAGSALAEQARAAARPFDDRRGAAPGRPARPGRRREPRRAPAAAGAASRLGDGLRRQRAAARQCAQRVERRRPRVEVLEVPARAPAPAGCRPRPPSPPATYCSLWLSGTMSSAVAVHQHGPHAGGQQRHRVGRRVPLGHLLGRAAEQRRHRTAAEPEPGALGERGHRGLRHAQRRPRGGPRRQAPAPSPAGRRAPHRARPAAPAAATRATAPGAPRRCARRRRPARGSTRSAKRPTAEVVVARGDVGQRGRPGHVGGRVVDVPDEEAAAGQVGGERVLERRVVLGAPVAAVDEHDGRQQTGVPARPAAATTPPSAAARRRTARHAARSRRRPAAAGAGLPRYRNQADRPAAAASHRRPTQAERDVVGSAGRTVHARPG